MPLPEENELPELSTSFGDDSEQKQRRQMLIALALLLLALILVLIKDRDFWFPATPDTSSETEPVEQVAPEMQPLAPATPNTTKTPASRPKGKSRTQPPPAVAENPVPALAPVVTSRTVLPPLEVEVVAGDEHRTIQAGTNSVKVDLQPRTPVTSGHIPSDSGRRGRCHWTGSPVGRSCPRSSRVQSSRLSSSGQTDESSRRGRAGSLDRAGREYPGSPHTQRPSHSFGRRPRSCEAMAIQALFTIR